MKQERLAEIRAAEKNSHLETYANYKLYDPGSWLAKPVKTVLELLPLFEHSSEVRILDLGSGVGRNSIAAARFFAGKSCRVDCVDILEDAIRRLRENAVSFGVENSIQGIVSSIDDFEIPADSYDLILAISALEHVDSRETFRRKLAQLSAGVRSGGVVCLVVNSNVTESDTRTGAELPPQFEVNLNTIDLKQLLHDCFAGWDVLKETVVHQAYRIPREQGEAKVETDVVTWVIRK